MWARSDRRFCILKVVYCQPLSFSTPQVLPAQAAHYASLQLGATDIFLFYIQDLHCRDNTRPPRGCHFRSVSSVSIGRCRASCPDTSTALPSGVRLVTDTHHTSSESPVSASSAAVPDLDLGLQQSPDQVVLHRVEPIALLRD